MTLKNIFTYKRISVSLIVTISILLLASYIDGCRKRGIIAKQNTTISLMNADKQEMIKERNKLNQLVVSQNAIIVNTQSDFKKLVEENFKLKNSRIKTVTSYVRIKSSTGVKDVAIPYKKDTTISFTIDNCPDNYIATPKKIEIDSTQNPNFQISAVVEKDSLRIKSINFPDSQHIAIVKTKGGFFKRDIKGKLKLYRKPSMEVKVLHTNPYIDIKGMSSIIYVPPDKNRWVERIAIVAGAVLLTIKILR